MSGGYEITIDLMASVFAITVTDIHGEKLVYTYGTDEDDAAAVLAGFIQRLEGDKAQTADDVRRITSDYPDFVSRPVDFSGLVQADPQTWTEFLDMIPVEIELEPT